MTPTNTDRTGSADWVVEADGLPTRDGGGHAVPDETPPTEAHRIRAGIRPEDHGLKLMECGNPDGWLATLDHVEVRQ